MHVQTVFLDTSWLHNVREMFLLFIPLYVTEPLIHSDFTNCLPSIYSVSVKFLGRIINGSPTDRNSIDELQQKLVLGLNITNKSSFKGTQKLWILQHLLIPRIQWSLLIYGISISHASFLEKKISKFIRKWLNIHSSTTDISLYSLISPCPLPIKSLTSILKSSKISGHLLLRDSKDPLVSSVSPSLKSGHWKATSATQITEAELNFRKIRGPLHLGRSSLGSVKPTPVPEEGSQAHRKTSSIPHGGRGGFVFPPPPGFSKISQFEKRFLPKLPCKLVLRMHLYFWKVLKA